jgi:hypothetical protein
VPIDALADALEDPALSDAEVERIAAEEVAFAINPESLRLVLAALPRLEATPGAWGKPLCGAVAKITSVDKALADEAAREGVRSVSPSLLEADWIATRSALFYVTPQMLSVLWWEWRIVTAMTKGKERWKFSGVVIEKADGERLELRTSREASRLLVALGERFVIPG